MQPCSALPEVCLTHFQPLPFRAPAHLSPGCPPTLTPSLCSPAVAHLQQVLRALPHLEAVEVEGLTPEAIGALLPAWQEALQQRSHEGCTIAGEGGALRFARVAE